MKLTKEQIESLMEDSAAEVSVYEWNELCRLALLGLERDERAERIGRAVLDVLPTHRTESQAALMSELAQLHDVASDRMGWGKGGHVTRILRAIAAALRDEAGR